MDGHHSIFITTGRKGGVAGGALAEWMLFIEAIFIAVGSLWICSFTVVFIVCKQSTLQVFTKVAVHFWQKDSKLHHGRQNKGDSVENRQMLGCVDRIRRSKWCNAEVLEVGMRLPTRCPGDNEELALDQGLLNSACTVVESKRPYWNLIRAPISEFDLMS